MICTNDSPWWWCAAFSVAYTCDAFQSTVCATKEAFAMLSVTESGRSGVIGEPPGCVLDRPPCAPARPPFVR